MDVFDDVIERHRVREQFVVLFGVGQNRQHPNLMNQTAQCSLIRFQLGVASAQGITDASDFQALTPHLAHFLFDHVRACMEDLLHDQPDGQIAAVIDPQARNGCVQVGDFLSGAQQRTVNHFNQAGRQRGVTANDFA